MNNFPAIRHKSSFLNFDLRGLLKGTDQSSKFNVALLSFLIAELIQCESITDCHAFLY